MQVIISEEKEFVHLLIVQLISFIEYGMNMAGLNIFRTQKTKLPEQLCFSDLCLFSALASLQNTFSHTLNAIRLQHKATALC